MKKIIKIIFILTVFMGVMVSCNTEDPQPTEPVFDGTTKIEIDFNATQIIWSKAEGVKYIVYVFIDTGSAPTESTITPKTFDRNPKGGAYWGTPGIGSDYLPFDSIKTYNSSTQLFEDPTISINLGDWCVVLGTVNNIVQYSSPANQRP